MRHSIEYKNSRYRKTIGFIKLDKAEYSLDLKIIRSCDRYQPIVEKVYEEVLKIIKKHYNVIDSGFNVHKTNMYNNSRVLNKRNKIKVIKCEKKKI